VKVLALPPVPAAGRPHRLHRLRRGQSQVQKINKKNISVEGLYCKKPIQCLASSEILTHRPPPPHRPASVYPAAIGGGGHTRWVERGWGVNSSEDARHCSVLYICKYFVNISFLIRKPNVCQALASRFLLLYFQKLGSVGRDFSKVKTFLLEGIFLEKHYFKLITSRHRQIRFLK
jgi:hypothetical protein